MMKMKMTIDKTKLAELIKSTRSQDLLIESVTSLEKNSLQQAIASIQKFSGKSDVTVIVIKK